VQNIVVIFLEVDMIVRLKVALDQPEYSALLQLATIELRNPEGQLRYILRRELQRSKFIKVDTESQKVGDHLKGAKDE
jgi:hypothetical protein